MKKTLFYSIAMLMCTMLMVGCNGQNEPQTPDQPEQPEDTTTTVVKPVAALLDYQFEVTEEMLEVANFTISYYDKDGELQTEQLESTKWDKIIVAKLPAKLGVQVNAALREDFDSTKYEVFRALKKYYYFAYAVGSDGKQADSEIPFTNNTHSDMAGSQIETFFNLYKEKPFAQVLFTFDEDGKKTYHSEWE